MKGIKSLLCKLNEINDKSIGVKAVLRPYQQELKDDFLNGEIDKLMICWSRRLGKDYLAFSLAVETALKKSGSIIAYILPTAKQAKAVIVDGKTLTGESWIDTIVNRNVINLSRSGEIVRHDSTIRFKNGSIIYLYGSDTADTKVGGNIDLLVISETALIKNQEILDYLIPSTILVGGKIILVSTPRFGSKFNKMVNDTDIDDVWHKSVISAIDDKAIGVDGTKVYTDEMLDSARKTMSEEKFKQEYLCDTKTANESSIYSKSIEMATIDNTFKIKPNSRLVVSFDLGINDATSLQFGIDEGDKVRIVHHYHNNNEPSEHYKDYIKEFMKKNKIGNVRIVLPHDGKNRHDLGDKLMSREDYYRQFFGNVEVLKRTAVMESIEMLRRYIQNGDIIFSNVDDMLDMLRAYEWKFRNGENTYTPIHGVKLSASNTADSLEYMAVWLNKQNKIREIEKSYDKIVRNTY